MSELAFEAFPSIPRMFRDCVISEKIDGTNAVIHIADDGVTIRAGSRSRWVEAEPKAADNHGFAGWVKAHEAELLSLGPGWHYGEWWGAGIQRRYGLSEKRFSLFNVGRWGEGGPDVEKKPACCHVVPVLYRGPFATDIVTRVAHDLGEKGSVAAPGFMQPEGVVVYVNRSLFKFTLDGDGHKGAKS